MNFKFIPILIVVLATIFSAAITIPTGPNIFKRQDDNKDINIANAIAAFGYLATYGELEKHTNTSFEQLAEVLAPFCICTKVFRYKKSVDL
ncbi:hypothetical protein F8M41_004647 [Gigaspora margarita]|uniref:LAGLIDADG endonuclease n=1 Tax=Gigaspora margarita TaxID=4874 RepID=A0A8H3XAS0_GIGMA|nr:hypothetical protein F8M41_004647 [Gigaspora margarita]